MPDKSDKKIEQGGITASSGSVEDFKILAAVIRALRTQSLIIGPAGNTVSLAAGLLSLSSVTKGLIFSRMTTAQRDAIVNPIAGLVIYNTTTNKLNVYTTAWEGITSA